jgi:hypothetical protein
MVGDARLSMCVFCHLSLVFPPLIPHTPTNQSHTIPDTTMAAAHPLAGGAGGPDFGAPQGCAQVCRYVLTRCVCMWCWLSERERGGRGKGIGEGEIMARLKLPIHPSVPHSRQPPTHSAPTSTNSPTPQTQSKPTQKQKQLRRGARPRAPAQFPLPTVGEGGGQQAGL